MNTNSKINTNMNTNMNSLDTYSYNNASGVFKLIDIFMFSDEDSTNYDLENRLNFLLDTGMDEEEERETVNRIGNYTTIEQLGKNPKDVEYIENKIKKFLGTSKEDLVDCFLLSNGEYGDICNDGFSDRPMRILSRLMSLQSDNSFLEEGLYEEKIVIKKLVRYVPNLMKKILDISEKIEQTRCDMVSKKTLLYKEIYKDLFIDSHMMKMQLPDLGISSFLEDFNRNIYTKIILIVLVTFLISKIISLFKININS